MNLGFFTMPIHPLDKDWRVCLREDREAFILADELGFTEGYIGEHVTDRAENITSCAMFIASLVDATKRIKLGTGTINMPNAHPAQVAANIAMLDHMLDGRFIFGISPGGLLSDAEIFGNLDANRNEMFLECINQVLALWSGEPPYDLKGKYWTISTARTLVDEIGQGFVAKRHFARRLYLFRASRRRSCGRAMTSRSLIPFMVSAATMALMTASSVAWTVARKIGSRESLGSMDS